VDGCAVLDTIGSYQWNADVYGSLSVASRLAAIIKERSAFIKLSYDLRRLNSKINGFLDQFHGIMEGRIPPSQNAVSEPLTPERHENAIRLMRQLSAVLADVYLSAKRKRYTNNSLVAGPLSTLHQNAETISEMADWLVMALHPEGFEQVFDRANQERERGEVFDIGQVQ
jgi:hypothetical protein